MPITVIGIMETLKGLLQSAVPLPPLPVTEPERQSKLRSILTQVGRSIKSNFVDTLHKKSKRDSPTPESSAASSKRRQVVVTPSTPIFPRRPLTGSISSLSSGSFDSRLGTNAAISQVMYGNLGYSPSVLSSLSDDPTVLSSAKMGLRRLSVGEVIDLKVGSMLVVIFRDSSVITKKYQSILLHQLRNELQHLNGRNKIAECQRIMEDRHSFLRNGSTFFEFPCRIVSYPKRHELFDSTVDRSTLRRWMDQGEGFTMELLQYPARVVLKWNELCKPETLECWHAADRNSCTYSEWDFGTPRNTSSLVNKLEHNLALVDGDVHQITSVLLAYYQKRSQCLQPTYPLPSCV
jgi:hypothetical protein